MGVVLFNYNIQFVIVSSLLLFISMICTIVLTVDSDYRDGQRKDQDLYALVRVQINPILILNHRQFLKFKVYF